MPRTVLTKTLLPTGFAVAGATPTVTTGDTVNNHSCVLTGNEIVVAMNTDTAGAHTVTVSSQPDQEGRTGDIAADSVPACVGTTPGFRVYQRFPLNGWLQADGNLYLATNSALIKFIVLQIQ